MPRQKPSLKVTGNLLIVEGNDMPHSMTDTCHAWLEAHPDKEVVQVTTQQCTDGRSTHLIVVLKDKS